MAEKSLIVTYLLWLSVGWLGVHHFYLRRDRHAFVWLCTLGGCCGVGWFLELFRLHSYVELANGYGYETEYQAIQIRQRQSPEFAWKRFLGELFFSTLLGLLSAAAIPEELMLNWRLIVAFSSFFVGVGVHTVANIGNERCSFGVCLIGAFIPLPTTLLSSADNLVTIITYSAITSAVYSSWIGKQWKPLDLRSADSRSHLCTRLAVFAAASVIVGTMMMSTIYFNCHVIARDGQRVRFKDAYRHLGESPFWKEKWQTAKRLYYRLVDDGLLSLWLELNIALDPEGEESAYRVLELTSSATQKEITERYRHLVKLHHPDKVHAVTELDRQKAQQRFIEIEQAYSKLSTIRQRRSENSQKNVCK